MSPNLPDDAEIGYCRLRLLPLIGLGAAMLGPGDLYLDSSREFRIRITSMRRLPKQEI
jgi:hypothetical protein